MGLNARLRETSGALVTGFDAKFRRAKHDSLNLARGCSTISMACVPARSLPCDLSRLGRRFSHVRFGIFCSHVSARMPRHNPTRFDHGNLQKWPQSTKKQSNQAQKAINNVELSRSKFVSHQHQLSHTNKRLISSVQVAKLRRGRAEKRETSDY